jgi:hypothetical protein
MARLIAPTLMDILHVVIATDFGLAHDSTSAFRDRQVSSAETRRLRGSGSSNFYED